MFILPLSLFLVTTYLRPRTQAELSYLITAIECLSGLWCLLFAPFSIQISLIGLLLWRNTKEISSLLSGLNGQASNIDLSESAALTIDIVAHSEHQAYLASAMEDHHAAFDPNVVIGETKPTTLVIESNLTPTSAPTIYTAAAPTQITLYAPQSTQKHLRTVCTQPQPLAPVMTPHVVEMQYRGVTYFKSMPAMSSRSDSGPDQGSTTPLRT